MIDWGLVGSIVVALSIYHLCSSLGYFIYSWFTRGDNANMEEDESKENRT